MYSSFVRLSAPAAPPLFSMFTSLPLLFLALMGSTSRTKHHHEMKSPKFKNSLAVVLMPILKSCTLVSRQFCIRIRSLWRWRVAFWTLVFLWYLHYFIFYWLLDITDNILYVWYRSLVWSFSGRVLCKVQSMRSLVLWVDIYYPVFLQPQLLGL